MSFYDDASLVFLPSGGAGKDGKAYSIKPVEELGSELVTNGGFDTDSDWTKGTGWTISGGTASCDGTQTTNSLLYQNLGDLSNKTIKLTFTISGYSAGQLSTAFFGAAGTQVENVSANGTYTFDIDVQSGHNGNTGFTANSSFIGSVDNVSVKEITTPLADFTFSRGGNLTATRVDSNGLIEKGRENLLVNSVWDGVTTNTKPTGWTTQLVSGTGTFDVTATEGQIRFQTLDASSRSFIYSPTITTNGIVVASVYVDEVTTAMPLIQLLSRSGNATDLFAYEDGVEINYSDNVQAGKRYSVVFNKTASTNFRFGVGVSSGTLGDVVLSRPQIEVGLVATEWITSPVGSTGKAGILEDSPRFDYSGGASCPSLLLEPSRTNIVPISEGIPEDINAVTLTENYGTSPEGLQNSLKVQKDGVSSNDRILPIDNYNATLVSGTSYFVSAFVKNIDVDNGGLTTIGCRISGGSLFRLAYEWTGSSLAKNTTTGSSTGTRVNEICEDYGNGWWRIGFGFEADGTTSNIEIDVDRQNSSATTSIETYGWQLEQGSYPTSYIPNHSGGSETRNADECTKTSISGLIGQTEGTIYCEFEYNGAADSGVFNRIIGLGTGVTQNRILLAKNDTTAELVAFAVSGGTTQVFQAIAGTSIIGHHKVAISYKANEYKVYLDGELEFTDTSASVPATTDVYIGTAEDGTTDNELGGVVKQSIIYKEVLSEDNCKALTTL